jgi:hypothetical protein
MKDSSNYFIAALTELDKIVKYMPKYALQLKEDFTCRVQLDTAFTFVKIHLLFIIINSF